MKQVCVLFCAFLLLSHTTYCQQFRADKIKLLGRWCLENSDTTLSRTYMGVYGYAQNGREYAIQSANDGTYIIDVTQPSSPLMVSFIPSRETKAGWREYRTYKHYLYMVSDGTSKGGLQIADLSYLPDSVHLVYAEDTFWVNSHTITIDGDKLYGNATKYKGPFNNYYPKSMSVYSLSNPEKPTLLRHLNEDVSSIISRVHDCFVSNDTVYASCGYDGFWVLRLDSSNHFNIIGHTFGYIYYGYNHSSCFTSNRRYMIVLDEVPKGLPGKVMDVSDPVDMEVVATFTSGSLATPHNPYTCRNGFIAVAYYQDGLQIFDLNNPLEPVLAGYFDTHYQTSATEADGEYQGAWGAYADLPSGRILVSDMQNGLFVLDADSILGKPEPVMYLPVVQIFPNPAIHTVTVKTHNDVSQSHIVVYDLMGQVLTDVFFRRDYNLDVSNFQAGVYPTVITSFGKETRLKLVVH